jgi:hypothetical protein
MTSHDRMANGVESKEAVCTCGCLYHETMALPESHDRKIHRDKALYPLRGERYMINCQCCDQHNCPIHYPKEKS